MTLAPTDFPDWNPPRDRIVSRVGPAHADTVPTGDAPGVGFTGTDADNVLTVGVTLQPGTGVAVFASQGSVSPNPTRQVANIATVDYLAKVPMVHYGLGGGVQIFNASGADFDYGWQLDSYSGVDPNSFLPETLDQIFGDVAVPAMGDGDPVDVPNAAMYTRCTICVVADQAFSVTVRRAMFQQDHMSGDWVLTTFDDAVGVLTGGVVDVPVGAPGFAVILSGTSITAGTAQLLTRCYRPSGF